ncbi:hypothetical protein HU200_001314 [Digitaria exilis]|uniref:Uncharacterized protein n=1 Tax=Digitaria exilis TaxID=1010633 RepID=A0A835FZ61_9POAL|nr:hypothetical protein HU200_001314 [Digitaria exilis]
MLGQAGVCSARRTASR